MDKVQSIPNQSQIPKNGQASGKFSDSGPSNPQNSDRLWADFGPSNPHNRGQPYIGASRGLRRCPGRPGLSLGLQRLASPVLAHSGTLAIHMKQWLTTVPSKSSIFALYRSLLRQTRRLPHEYLRYFFSIPPSLVLICDLLWQAIFSPQTVC